MTDPLLHARASALFVELRGLTSEDRAARLQTLLDPALRDEVEALLAFDSPEPDAPGSPAGLESGEWIGPYRVLRRLGRGATGYVLLAEQSSPVRRQVAIKLVPQALVDPVIAARFESERRALEQLDHPSIARVLDAGNTAHGLPYLVMEHVDGPAITEYCREARLPLVARIALMLDVADAVQHAHQRGLIHRDLKPANILVGMLDDRPMPRVVDFGIARSTLDQGPDLTGGSPIGTPAYMAPEQASGRPTDTRADIYAFGAVLYELAAGDPPLVLSGDLAAALPRIRDERPAPAARTRGARFPADRPPQALLADLDRVLDRALEKDPARRYPTIAAMAEDLRRVLAREPISARRASLPYRTARFVERRRPLVAAIGIAAAASIFGIVGLVAGRIESERQRAVALDRAESLAAVNRFLTEDLLAGASPDQSAEGTTAVELLDRAAARVETRFAGRPLLAAELHHTLGLAYTRLGAFDAADHHLRLAIALRTEHAGADQPSTLRSRLAAASLLGERQDFGGAAAALSDLLPRARLILGADDPTLYAALSDLGTVLDTLGRGEEAVPLLTEALIGRRRLLGAEDPLTLITVSNLAQAHDGLGDSARALELMLEALQIARAQPEPSPMLLIGLANNIGATYQDLGQYEAAAPYLREASDRAAAWLGPDNPATLTLLANVAGLEARLGEPALAAELYRRVVEARVPLLGADAFDTLAARHGLANSLLLAGETELAARNFSALLADVERSLGTDHWLSAQTRLSLASAFGELGQTEDARTHAEHAHRLLLDLFGPDHPRTAAAAALLDELGTPNATPARDPAGE